MVYLYYISFLRYTILVGNPRYAVDYMFLYLLAFLFIHVYVHLSCMMTLCEACTFHRFVANTWTLNIPRIVFNQV